MTEWEWDVRKREREAWCQHELNCAAHAQADRRLYEVEYEAAPLKEWAERREKREANGWELAEYGQTANMILMTGYFRKPKPTTTERNEMSYKSAVYPGGVSSGVSDPVRMGPHAGRAELGPDQVARSGRPEPSGTVKGSKVEERLVWLITAVKSLGQVTEEMERKLAVASREEAEEPNKPAPAEDKLPACHLVEVLEKQTNELTRQRLRLERMIRLLEI